MSDLKALIIEYMDAERSLHEVHGSTAVHGGIGGQTVTEHCAYVCPHQKHEAQQDRYEEARRALWPVVEAMD